MRLTTISAFLLLASSMGLHASGLAPHQGVSESAPLTADFSVAKDTTIPGKTLKPGNYTIRIVDHLHDRMILRVEARDGKTESTFLGIPNQSLSSVGAPGPVQWPSKADREQTLRGYSFPGNYSVEFVYPKAEAVKIAQANSSQVVAIDPASDNLTPKAKNLSRDDMQIVTLWALSPTKIGPGQTPAIQASKYSAPASAAPATYEARNEVPANPAASVAETHRRPQPVASARPAAAPRKPVLARLPHTASELPIILLSGLLSLLGIVALRIERHFAHEE